MLNKLKKSITEHQGKSLFRIDSFWGIEEFGYISLTYHFHIWVVFEDEVTANRLRRMNQFLRQQWRKLLEAENLIPKDSPPSYYPKLAYIKPTMDQAGALKYSAKCCSFKPGKPWHISKRFKPKGKFDFHYNLPRAVREANHQKSLLSQHKRARGLIESFTFHKSVKDKVGAFRRLLKKQELLFS